MGDKDGINLVLLFCIFVISIFLFFDDNFVFADLKTTLDSAGNVGEYTSIAIGTDGNPVISYYDASDDDLKLVHCTNVSCTAQEDPVTLDSDGNVGQWTSIAIGTDGNPVISYLDFSNFNLKLVHCNDLSCTAPVTPITLVDFVEVGFYTSIAIGSDGFPVISYYDGTNGKLMLVHCTNVDCTETSLNSIVDEGGNVGLYTSIAIGTDGFPVIGYLDSTNSNPKLVHCNSLTCSSRIPITLDNSGSGAENISIAIGTDGFPVISYHATLIGDLKLIHCTNVACTENDSAISLDSDTVGFYSSIAIGSDGLPVISYLDGPNSDLKVVHCITVSCSANDKPITLDSVGNAGFHTSVAIGIDGLPVISYQDAASFDLKVVHCSTVSCSAQNTLVTLEDSANTVGLYTSIAIGTDGNPVISYFDADNFEINLVHCTNALCTEKDDPVTLDITSVDIGFSTSIAIGSDGYPVISYRGAVNGDLMVVHCTDVSCSSPDPRVTLDSDGSVGQHSSIAIGSDGNPVISYYKLSTNDLKLVHCTNVTCTDQDNPLKLKDDGRYTSIAIGTDGNPVISYLDEFSDNLELIHCKNVSCSIRDNPVTLDGSGDVGRFSSIAIGNDGNPVISYLDESNDDLKLVHCTNVSCSTKDAPVVLDSADAVGRYSSLAIGNDGNPVISYYDETNFNLKLVHCTNVSCTAQDAPVTLDSSANSVGLYTSIAIGTDGNPVISYHDASDGNLKAIHCATVSCNSLGTWSSPLKLDSAVGTGTYTSIAIGSDGFPVISYRDSSNPRLKLAHCTNVSCTAKDDPVILDSAGNVGLYNSIAIGTDGNPVVSYYDASNNDLKLVHCTNVGCTEQDDPIILDDTAANVGLYTSIAIGTDGNPVVSYFDSGNAELKLVHCTNVSCSARDPIIPLDLVNAVGSHTSIAIGSDGNPVVSYRDITQLVLKLVHCTTVSCSSQDVPVILDISFNVGQYTSLAIGSDGNPVISYLDEINDDLKLVHCTNVSCTAKDPPVVLDSAGDVGEYTSIAIGSDGYPMISYNDFTNRDLKLVHCTNVSCTEQDNPITLDSEGFVGRYTSIAIGSNNFPVISYHDGTNGGLKLITGPVELCFPFGSSTWVIGANCSLDGNRIALGNILIQNNSILTIPAEHELDVDFANNNLIVEQGSGASIEFDGKIT